MIVEYTDHHVHRIRLDFSDLKEVPKLVHVKSISDVVENSSKLLGAAISVISDIRKSWKLYSVLTHQGGKLWLSGYDK